MAIDFTQRKSVGYADTDIDDYIWVSSDTAFALGDPEVLDSADNSRVVFKLIIEDDDGVLWMMYKVYDLEEYDYGYRGVGDDSVITVKETDSFGNRYKEHYFRCVRVEKVKSLKKVTGYVPVIK